MLPLHFPGRGKQHMGETHLASFNKWLSRASSTLPVPTGSRACGSDLMARRMCPWGSGDSAGHPFLEGGSYSPSPYFFFFSLYTKVEVTLLGMLPAFPQWPLSTVLSALHGAVQSSCRVCREPGRIGPKGSILQDREPHIASRPGLSSDPASPAGVGQDRVLPSSPLPPAQGGLLHLGPALRIAQGMPLPPHL